MRSSSWRCRAVTSKLIIAAILILAAAAPLRAQPPGWTVTFAAGAATPVNDISSRLSTGWNVDAGVGYEFNSWLSLFGDFAFARMGVPADVLQESSAPDGYGHILALTIDPKVQFPLAAHLQGFVIGGAGWIHRTVTLTAPDVQYVDDYDPYYGDLGPQPIAVEQVLGATTRNALGEDIGGGVSYPLPSIGAELFASVRYYYAPTTPRVTAMIPVTFGVRFTPSRLKP